MARKGSRQQVNSNIYIHVNAGRQDDLKYESGVSAKKLEAEYLEDILSS